MTSLVLALLLSQAPDAPAQPRAAIVVQAGQLVPWDGVLMDDAMSMRTAKRLAYAEAAVAETDGKLVIPLPAVVAAVAVVVAVVAGSAAAGYAAGRSGK